MEDDSIITIFSTTLLSTILISISTITLVLFGCWKKRGPPATGGTGGSATPAPGADSTAAAATGDGKSQLKGPPSTATGVGAAPSGSDGAKPTDKKDDKPKTEEKKDVSKKGEKKDKTNRSVKSVKSTKSKKKTKEEQQKEEEEAGYEQCADMTPEQMKAIADATK